MSDTAVVTAPFDGPLKAAWLWDRQVRSLPLRWHPDWLPTGGWPSMARALPSTVALPQWVAQRLGPLPGWQALNSVQLKPALCSLEHAVVLLARLALHLRPQQKRFLISDRQWLTSLELAHPSVTERGLVLKSHRALAPGLAEWAAVGLHDWAQLLGHQDRAAFLLLRRCFPARQTLRWIRRLSPQPVAFPEDWALAFEPAQGLQ